MPDMRTSGKELVIDLPARRALHRLRFITHSYTGIDPQTLPGVTYDLTLTIDPSLLCHRVRNPDGTVEWRIPGNVIPRSEVRKLRNALTDFLLDFPEEEPDL